MIYLSFSLYSFYQHHTLQFNVMMHLSEFVSEDNNEMEPLFDNNEPDNCFQRFKNTINSIVVNVYNCVQNSTSDTLFLSVSLGLFIISFIIFFAALLSTNISVIIISGFILLLTIIYILYSLICYNPDI